MSNLTSVTGFARVFDRIFPALFLALGTATAFAVVAITG
jgi:hypothetical protein